MTFEQLGVLYIVCINLYVLFLMRYDKQQAIKRKRRIPEKYFFALFLLGGGIGGLTAMHVFRHKTKHLSFYIWNLIGIALLFIVYWKWTRG